MVQINDASTEIRDNAEDRVTHLEILLYSLQQQVHTLRLGVFVDTFKEITKILWVYTRGNTMTKIEDMALGSSIHCKAQSCPLNLPGNGLTPPVQHIRIHIALKGYLSPR